MSQSNKTAKVGDSEFPQIIKLLEELKSWHFILGQRIGTIG